MKTRGIVIVITILLSMVSTKAWAYDIAVKNSKGVTIYYNYIKYGKELEVTSAENIKYKNSVVIPIEVTYKNQTSKVTSIGNDAFFKCSGLTSVTIPNSVTRIGDDAFAYCSGLTSVTIPNSVTRIGYRAFSSCSGLTSIKVESGNTSYDSRDNCNAIIETESNTLIAGCQSTTIPNSVTSIGGYAFRGCSGLTSVTIGNSVTSIGDFAFGGCSGLTSVTIPNSVTTIGAFAFQGCSGLTSVAIGSSVTRIRLRAFYGCNGLTSVTIPNSVTSIEKYAFSGCIGLTSVTSEIENPFDINDNTFSDDTYSNAKLYVPAGKTNKYKAAEGWQRFASIAEASSSGINDVGSGRTKETKRFTLDGRAIKNSHKGLNIIKMDDGTTKKVIVK